MAQLSTAYTESPTLSTKMHRRTDVQTDRQTDDSMLPITDQLTSFMFIHQLKH